MKGINFKPGLKEEFQYHVFGVPSETEMELYVSGDLAQYISLDKNSLFGEGVFTAYLNLPENIQVPGTHKVYIGIKEKIDDELVEAIGTSITIEVLINVYVPYPGKYLVLDLTSKNVNQGEKLDFNLDITNYGKENVSVFPRIEIFSGENLLETLGFSEKSIESQASVKLKKSLDTINYSSGSYNAIAIVNYDEQIATDEHSFRIGELSLNLINYTNKIYVGKLRRFDIGIESDWNNLINGANAQVDLYKDSIFIEGFKTTSSDLSAFGSAIISGYVDATNFSVGDYNTKIKINYFGEGISKSLEKEVIVTFEKETNTLLISVILLVVLIIISIVIFVLRPKKNGKKK